MILMPNGTLSPMLSAAGLAIGGNSVAQSPAGIASPLMMAAGPAKLDSAERRKLT